MLPVGLRAASIESPRDSRPGIEAPDSLRNGTNKKAQDRNKAVKSEVKTAIRATREAVTAGDKVKAAAALLLASKKLDKAASKGVIHKNQAANKKSAIAKQVSAL
jgi:small subunit ribosomal protein S20